jgi:hypothetical protein
MHPDWVLKHKQPNTEIKAIKGRYYLYGVKSVYNKATKRSQKVSLGILGSITKEQGFVASQKRVLQEKSEKTYHNKAALALEYGLSKWLLTALSTDNMLGELQKHFPNLWLFIVLMVYCRVGYQSPLKNVSFYLAQSDLQNLLGWQENLSDQKVSDMLFELGCDTKAIHAFLQPKDSQKRTVLIDATDIVLQSQHIPLAQKGYNSDMNFQSQFVLLYLYDANSLKPLYYRILPGNIREVSAMKNTLTIAGLEQCVYIADKGFFSQANIEELERLKMQYIIPLKRNNALIPYDKITDIEQTDDYFEFAKRFIFHTPTRKHESVNIELFLDGKLKEQEKTDYLKRIQTLPENFSKPAFNDKIKTMGTLAIMHNTTLNPKEIYLEYKTRGQIEQFFDHLKNTLDASASNMQREESLNAWIFINHISMTIIYQLYLTLKTTPLNKKHKLNHKYSIDDTIQHLKSIQKIQFAPNDYFIAEQNKLTKTLLLKLKIPIT